MKYFLRKAIALIMLGSAAAAFAQDAKYAPIVNAALADLKTKTELSLLSGHVAVNISSGNRELDARFAAALKEAYPNFTAKSGTVRNEDLYQMTVKIYYEDEEVFVNMIVKNFKQDKIVNRLVKIKNIPRSVMKTLQYKTALIAKNEFEAYLSTVFGDAGAVAKEIIPTAQLRIERGVAYAVKGDYKNAFFEFEEAVKLEPENAEAFYCIGFVYIITKNYDKAIEYYTRTININPVPMDDDFEDAYYQRAYCYYEKEDLNKAIDDYNESEKLRPKNADLYFYRGSTYLRKASKTGAGFEIEQAIKDFTQSINLDSKNAKAYSGRAIAYYNNDEHDKAIADCSKHIAFVPEDNFFYYLRASSYYAKGNKAKAVSDCKKSLEINPNHQKSKDLLALLQAPPPPKPVKVVKAKPPKAPKPDKYIDIWYLNALYSPGNLFGASFGLLKSNEATWGIDISTKNLWTTVENPDSKWFDIVPLFLALPGIRFLAAGAHLGALLGSSVGRVAIALLGHEDNHDDNITRTYELIPHYNIPFLRNTAWLSIGAGIQMNINNEFNFDIVAAPGITIPLADTIIVSGKYKYLFNPSAGTGEHSFQIGMGWVVEW